MDNKQKDVRRHQEDAALNRSLLWVGAAIVLEVLLVFLKRYYLEYRMELAAVELAETLGNVLRVLRIAGAVGAVVCLVWAFVQRKDKRRAVLPIVLTAACAAVAVCAHVTVAFQTSGVQMLYLLVAAWAGLALVFYLYQKEFFFAASACGLSILGLWFVRYTGGLSLEVLLCLAGVLLVLVSIFWLKRSDGVFAGDAVFPKGANYTVMLVTGIASLLVLAAAAVLGAAIAYYLLFVMAAWLFVLLVYYTVKLM
jgi:hypothetical protein